MRSRRLNGALWRYLKWCFWSWNCWKKIKDWCILTAFWSWNSWVNVEDNDALRCILSQFELSSPSWNCWENCEIKDAKQWCLTLSKQRGLFAFKSDFVFGLQFKSLIERVNEYATLRACIQHVNILMVHVSHIILYLCIHVLYKQGVKPNPYCFTWLSYLFSWWEVRSVKHVEP